MNDIEWHFACWESPQASAITSKVNQRGWLQGKKTTHSDWTKEPARNSHLYFRFQEDLQSQLSHSVRLYWLCEVQGLIHSTPLRLTHPAPVLRNLVLKWSSATVSLALLLLLLVPVRHLLQEFVPAKALGCIQRTRMSSASKMLRICEKGCWLECKWVASNVPSQAIVAMIHNVYNMYTNYSVHASHTTCMHCGTCPTQPIAHHQSAQPLLWTALWALSLRGPRCPVQPRSRGWSWKGNWKSIQLRFFGTQNGARSRPENSWWTFRVHKISVSSTTKISKTRRDVWKSLEMKPLGMWHYGVSKTSSNLEEFHPSLSPKLTTLGCIQTSYAMHF